MPTCFNGAVFVIDVGANRCGCASGLRGKYCHLGNGDDIKDILILKDIYKKMGYTKHDALFQTVVKKKQFSYVLSN